MSFVFRNFLKFGYLTRVRGGILWGDMKAVIASIFLAGAVASQAAIVTYNISGTSVAHPTITATGVLSFDDAVIGPNFKALRQICLSD